MVVACVMKDPYFAQLSPELQNILKWASLLHDIAKQSKPAIEGRDHIHPFKSAIIVLELFERFGFIPNLTESKKTQLYQVRRLLSESVQPVREEFQDGMEHGVPYCTQMHSHHNLPEIFHYMWRMQACPKGSFADLVFRLVMFHQSVQGMAAYPPMIALND